MTFATAPAPGVTRRVSPKVGVVAVALACSLAVYSLHENAGPSFSAVSKQMDSDNTTVAPIPEGNGTVSLASTEKAWAAASSSWVRRIFPVNGAAWFGLKSNRGGGYCADEGHAITCNRGAYGSWERFQLHDAGGGYWALKGGRSHQWCADEDGGVKCNRGAVGSWEKMYVHVINAAAGQVAFRGGRSGQWCADEGSRWICNRGSIGAWETFTVTNVACAGSYGSYGGCSGTCGAGNTKTRTLMKTTQASSIAGSCSQPDTQSAVCGSAPCPINCVGAFGAWGTCSKNCGGGTKSRTYSITTQAAHGGSACPHHNGKSETTACNSASCVHVGLKHAVWENIHGKADKWRNRHDRLVHVQAGAEDKNSAGEYKLDVTHPDATPSSECTLAKSFEAPVDSVHDGGQLIAGNLCVMPQCRMPACAHILMRRPPPLTPLSPQLPADHRRVHLLSLCGRRRRALVRLVRQHQGEDCVGQVFPGPPGHLRYCLTRAVPSRV